MVAILLTSKFTAIVLALVVSLSNASHIERSGREEIHHLAKLNLARSRGTALLATTTLTLPLANVRGRQTTTSSLTTGKATTSSKVTSTSKITTTKTSTKPTSQSTSRTTSKATTSSTRSTTTSKATSTKVSTTTKKTSTNTTSKPTTTSKSTTSTSKTTSKTTTTSTTAPMVSGRFPPSEKKGLAYNDAEYTKLFGSSVSWAYNWYSEPNVGLPSNIEFAPMLWSNATDLTSVWANNVKAGKARGGTHLLGFNEPDLGEQANMTVAQSVQGWKKYMEPYKKDYKLVSPAVTNGGSPMGVAYLQTFLANCTTCQIDAVALHWYDAAWNTGYFFNYMTDAIKAFSPRPIWLTEFRGSGTAAEQVKFINTVVPWLEQQPQIERYALFGLFEGSADDGNMITNGTLNEVGLAYARAV